MKKEYYKNIDLIRVLSCILILFYHLNILKGGYLVVCTFFVLSGYLSILSAYKKEKFSIIEYYKNKLKTIYLPVIAVSFITIAIISILNINYINLKPETNSILLGYNNFWQLNANLDYFTRHVDSPFMHLWYIAILLQFELVFPIIFIILKKIGDKIHKSLPSIITLGLAILSYTYFYMLCNENLMIGYYNTFARAFSLLFGMSAGFIKVYYKKDKIGNPILLSIYLMMLLIPTFIVEASSKYFVITMLFVTLLSTILVHYATYFKDKDDSVFYKVIKFLSSISYEIYLIQYPVIFLLQGIEIIIYIKVILIILITILLSYIIHKALDFKHILLLILISIISIFGIYQYVVAEDHTKEMKELEAQLKVNEEMMKLKQEEYANELKKEQEDWELKLKTIENDVDALKDVVNDLPVIGIGDSVMLGAVNELYKEFQKGYFDAQKSRTAWVVNGILKELKNKNMLGNPIVLGLGANGDCPEWCKEEIMDTIGDRNIFWLTTTWNKGEYVNNNIKEFAKKYDNIYVVDWAEVTKGHPEYLVSDGIHLSDEGKKVYVQTIYDSIYNAYLEEFNNKKDELIKEKELEEKKKISFYGNDLLLNAFDYIEKEFSNAKYVINNDFDYESLKKDIEDSITNNTLNYNIVLLFDSSFKITNNEYKELIEMCKDYKVYIIWKDKEILDNVVLIETDIDKYLMADKIHLTDEGNKKLSEILKEKVIL